MSAIGFLALGYAALMWAASWGLRRRAAGPGESWVEAHSAAFVRIIAVVPLAAGAALALAAAAGAHTTTGVVLPASAALALAWEAGRLVAVRRGLAPLTPGPGAADPGGAASSQRRAGPPDPAAARDSSAEKRMK